MKKMFLFGALFAVGLGFTACSSDKDVAENPQEPNSGESFVKIAIQLPTTPSTRADANQNDVFKDGESREYAVKDATLVLFEGTSATAATYSGNYSMNLSMNSKSPVDDQITTTAQIIQKVNNRTSETNNFYAYVVLNKPATFETIMSGASGKTFSQLFGTTGLLPDATTLTQPVVDGTSYIPMTNAPLAKYSGGSSAPTDATYSVLAEIDKDNIYPTEALAALNPATSIYVERAYAKATVTGTETKLKNTDGTDVSPEVTFSDVGWTLDNTNKKSYFQRNVDAYSTWYNLHSTIGTPTDVYRFTGSNAVATDKYRIYWATDPNYNDAVASKSEVDRTAYSTANFTLASTSNVTQPVGATNPMYCYENTFSVADQIHVCTTRAVICLQFNDGKGCYTLADDYAHKCTGADATAQQNALKQKVIDYLKADPKVWEEMAHPTNPVGIGCNR